MTDPPPEPSKNVEDLCCGDAIWVAGPFALGMTFFLARSIPVHFEPPPNPLGIISWSTRHGYAPFQEIFWYGFALTVGTLIAWGLSRIVAWRRPSPVRQATLEAVAALALLGIVILPVPGVAFALAFCAALALLAKGPGPSARETDSLWEPEAPVRRRQTHGLLFALAALVLALLLSPSLWLAVRAIARGTPDDDFASNAWGFQAEIGQHLASADGLLHGQAPGRDFFMLYGPLYPIGAVAAWSLLGRSIAVWSLYQASLNVLALLAALGLAVQLIRRHAICLALPLCFLPLVASYWYWGGLELRYGLALAGLACLLRAFERNSVRWIAAAGVFAGAGMLFSQEFALAFVLCAALALALRARWPEAIGFSAGFAAGAGPCLVWLAWIGALVPMLRDLVGYPGLVMAGFGKLPFPSALKLFPIPLSKLHTELALSLRLGYATPAVCWAGLLWAVRIDRLDPRHPIASLRRLRAELLSEPRRLAIGTVALFGLLAFRFALGRSALQNTIRVCGVAAIFLCVGFDRALDRWRSMRVLAAWRIVALTGVALLGGFVGIAAHAARACLTDTAMVAVAHFPIPVVDPDGRREVVGVLYWLREHADPTDRVLFLPNQAAYYYLAGRRSPIRFLLGHQMVTNAHRDEALAQLRAAPPRFIVFAPNSLSPDEIPHPEVLGPAIVSWIRENYRLQVQIESVEVLENQSSASGGSPGSPGR